MAKIKGLQEVAKASKNIVQSRPATWLTIYYSIGENRVTTKEEAGCYQVTQLIRECTEAEIEQTVKRFMYM